MQHQRAGVSTRTEALTGSNVYAEMESTAAYLETLEQGKQDGGLRELVLPGRLAPDHVTEKGERREAGRGLTHVFVDFVQKVL